MVMVMALMVMVMRKPKSKFSWSRRDNLAPTQSTHPPPISPEERAKFWQMCRGRAGHWSTPYPVCWNFATTHSPPSTLRNLLKAWIWQFLPAFATLSTDATDADDYDGDIKPKQDFPNSFNNFNDADFDNADGDDDDDEDGDGDDKDN